MKLYDSEKRGIIDPLAQRLMDLMRRWPAAEVSRSSNDGLDRVTLVVGILDIWLREDGAQNGVSGPQAYTVEALVLGRRFGRIGRSRRLYDYTALDLVEQLAVYASDGHRDWFATSTRVFVQQTLRSVPSVPTEPQWGRYGRSLWVSRYAFMDW